MYDITNEKKSIEKAIKFYNGLLIKILDETYNDLSNSISFKFNRWIKLKFGISYDVADYFVERRRNLCYDYYVNDHNYYMVKYALKDLHVWLEAINRGNDFTIDSFKYKDFLKYMKYCRS